MHVAIMHPMELSRVQGCATFETRQSSCCVNRIEGYYILAIFEKHVFRHPGEETSKAFESLGKRIDLSGIFTASPRID